MVGYFLTFAVVMAAWVTGCVAARCVWWDDKHGPAPGRTTPQVEHGTTYYATDAETRLQRQSNRAFVVGLALMGMFALIRWSVAPPEQEKPTHIP